MKHLIYKELSLSINKFFYLLPILLGALMFIPNWIYTIVFMYFFWISIPQIFAAFVSNRDYQMTASLPVARKNIVTSKIYSLLILEAFHIVVAVIFGIAHNAIYGSWNFFFDINLAFFGMIILLYGIYNLTFLPLYFKTALFFGKPAIYGVITTLIFAFLMEYGIVRYQWMKDLFEGHLTSQIIPFVVMAFLGISLSCLAIKRSQRNFRHVDL